MGEVAATNKITKGGRESASLPAPAPVDYPGGEESEDKPKSSGLKVQSRVSRILRRQSQEVATTGAAEEVEGEEEEEEARFQSRVSRILRRQSQEVATTG